MGNELGGGASSKLEPPSLSFLPGCGATTAVTLRGEQAYKDFLGAARRLVEQVQAREMEVLKLLRVTQNVSRGLGLEEVLEFVYQELRGIVPYNRIGCALIDEVANRVVARWAHSDRPVCLGIGYSASLAGSTLQTIIETGRPRILNNLPVYLEAKPQSESTRLIVQEGMKSSLTCPLISERKPVGFLFFASDKIDTYSDVHVEFFQEIAGHLGVILEKSRLYSELAEQAAVIERQNRQVQKELDMARGLQRALIPGQPPSVPGVEVAFTYEPAIQIGGDLMDLLPLENGRLLVFIGDSMGHGVEAAMLMAIAKTALHAVTRTLSNPAAVLHQINLELAGLIGDRFVTAACALLDPAAGLAEVALAGNVQPLRYDARSGGVTRLGDSGLPLGIRAGETYTTARSEFSPGDSLVFCTDGLVEAMNARGEVYGNERLAALVGRHGRSDAADLLQVIEADHKDHCQGLAAKDDVTVLLVRSQAHPAAGVASRCGSHACGG